MVIESDVQTIINRLIETLTPISIYLFGSFAKGNYNNDSDYDFYIIMPDDSGNMIDLSQKAYRSLKGLKRRPVDIVLNSKSVFEQRLKGNTLEAIVNREGKLIYER